MKCPNCGKDLELRPEVSKDVNSSGLCALAEALCCGRPVMVYDLPTIRVEKADTSMERDEWGHKFSYKNDTEQHIPIHKFTKGTEFRVCNEATRPLLYAGSLGRVIYSTDDPAIVEVALYGLPGSFYMFVRDLETV